MPAVLVAEALLEPIDSSTDLPCFTRASFSASSSSSQVLLVLAMSRTSRNGSATVMQVATRLPSR